jgi:hypothetical protein
MASQTRSSKRNIDTVEPESPNPNRTSARKKKPSYKASQTTLLFAPAAPSQLSQVSTPYRSPLALSSQASTREPSLSPTPSGPTSRASSSAPSAPSTHRLKATTIRALKRAAFEVDFSIVGPEYSMRARTNRSIAHSRISWIYLHGVELEKGKHKYWLCKYCYDVGKSKVLAAYSTASCGKHLVNSHGIYPPGQTAPSTGNRPVDTYLEGVHPLQAERWREDFVSWIAHDNISFEQAASPYLRKVILGGGPNIQHLLPCARTVRSWLTTTYNERIAEVKTSLARSRSKITVSFDAWSSPNHASLLGVVGHWIDSKRKLRTGLLGLKVLDGHYGADMADVLLKLIRTYNIEDKIGAFQTDNASNNDTALAVLAANMTGAFDTKQLRLRCFGHIINLVVKALLFSNASPSLQEQLGEAGDEGAFNVWREQGAIGKLHNIVYYITRSDSRRRAFEAAQKVDSSELTL